jgi:hypothetical protein
MNPMVILAILVLLALFVWFGGRALLSWVLGEILDRPGALREIFAALKPGGFLLVSEVMVDPHYQSLAKVKQLAEACGFRPGALHGNRFQYALVLEKPGRP